MVDEVNTENGPLEVWADTHSGTIHTLWHDGQFTGAVSDEITEQALQKRSFCTGRAGSVCLMHTRLLHGSSPNRSGASRTLFICVYSAADAMPISPSPVPTAHQGMIVRGEDKGLVRSVDFHMPMPKLPEGASFFDQQQKG